MATRTSRGSANTSTGIDHLRMVSSYATETLALRSAISSMRLEWCITSTGSLRLRARGGSHPVPTGAHSGTGLRLPDFGGAPAHGPFDAS